ncbi:uncharacterized protein DUF4199 [Salegentibacter sp. 24]|uniref:DUF4199 family protein n=1 Tax=Salegentibacter sp. 24 TaxID=2183986 RepID=UPI00105C4CD7|nr:DUF4199 family protein [Salegentibacter sp. 24]TDN95548.1 uncharacterized protein DUF4199 [Salegentibacter sp. 24]
MKNFSVPIKYGLIIVVGLIAYFLILSLFNLHIYPLFSLFNGVIMALGMWLALKAYRNSKGAKFKYQKGFMASLLTGFNATIVFTIFFAFYATELNANYLSNLINMWRTDYGTEIGIVLFVVAIMGFATTLVLTLAYMQLFKDSWNTKEGQQHTY